MRSSRWLLIRMVALIAVLGLALSTTVVRAASPSGLVQQEEDPEEVEVIGEVVGIDEDSGTLTVDVDGEIYVVLVPSDFDWDAIEVGDVVEVEGVLDEKDVLVADKVKVEDEDDDDDEGEDGDGVNFFCTSEDAQHPVGKALSNLYDVTYDDVMMWFCDEGMGFGQIMLALQTAKLTGEEASDYLGRRSAGEGWGRIWQSLDLIGRNKEPGRPEHAGPPEDLGENGRPEHAGPPEDLGEGGPPEHAGPPEDLGENGRPEHAGPPEDRGEGGPPEHAGPPEGAGRP
jgi:hypothetical protein